MTDPNDLDWQVVPWNGDEFIDLATEWVLDVHRDDIEKAEMNGQAQAHALHVITAFEVNPLCALYGIIIEGKPGGVLGVLHQNRFTSSAELALFLDRKWQGSGLGRLIGVKVIETLGEAGFKDLVAVPLSRLSRNMLQRLGFEERPVELTLMGRSADSNG